ncbi:biotin transporter BioY [Blautia hydrogenotrophica]|uniref:biotin transporter BioY n=1 Tax=Blautia hydrogenotrophica TaxID=53443 RepID=UPI0006C68317|nr:biotin transporter BioY [Blautia hydrogenotrophica]MEE0461582.1 biotin transporter BioY [Blautia hydrogenotrophica]CUN11662.1 Biotin ECF transporter S component BioY2 [Blautia hydrogenotrophica]SCH68901.1 Biotin ECF transporter S component BioY2 [uncultured Blautia sp.]
MNNTTTVKNRPQNKTRDMVYISFFAIVIAIGSWISIPTMIPFTLQTFAVFITVGILGGKRGAAAVSLYILLGVVGIPVFAGFKGGIGVLLGNTGGYILGFLLTVLVMWGIEKLFGKKTVTLLFSMILGLIVCYAFGTAWFITVYMRTSGNIGVMTVLSWCVIPFILPDLVKIALAILVSKRVSRYTKIEN